jgi:RNA polymerase sigma factor (sigma-70 family)
MLVMDHAMLLRNRNTFPVCGRSIMNPNPRSCSVLAPGPPHAYRGGPEPGRGQVLRPPDRAPQVLTALLSAPGPEERERAWAAFLEAYTRILLHTAHRFVHTYDDTMDCYAYVLEQLHRNDCRRLRAFSPVGTGSFTTWLVVVARRLIQDHHRARHGRVNRSSGEDRQDRGASVALRRNLARMTGEEFASSGEDACGSESPEVTAEVDERAEALRQAVSGLPTRDQLLLKLRYEKELTAQEIARVMGFASPFHVYRRLRKVRSVLGGLLHPEYADAAP